MTKRAAPKKTQRLAKVLKNDLRCSVGSASAKKRWIKLKGFGIESLKIQSHNKKKKRRTRRRTSSLMGTRSRRLRTCLKTSMPIVFLALNRRCVP